MAAAYTSTSSASDSSGSGTSVNPGAPSGAASGHAQIAIFAASVVAPGTPPTITLPTGFVSVDESTPTLFGGAINARFVLAVRESWNGTDGWGISVGSGAYLSAVVHDFSGTDGANAYHTYDTGPGYVASTSLTVFGGFVTDVDDELVVMLGLHDNAATFSGYGGASYTERYDDGTGTYCATATVASASTDIGDQSVTASVSGAGKVYVVGLRPSVGSTTTQEGYRFRADDGSETTATWLAAQDTGITRAADSAARLRVIVNGTGDVASAQYRLEHRVNAGAWTATAPPVTEVDPSWGAVGTAASGTTSCTPSYPTGITTASAIFCVVTGRSNTAGTAPTMPAGWTVVSGADLEDGTGTWGVDTGTRRVTIFRKDTVSGSESGTVTVSLSGTTANTLRASIFRVEIPADHTLDVAAASGADTSNGTAYSATTGSLDVAAGDLLILATAQNIDSGTLSSVAVSQSGTTFGTLTSRASTAVTNGNDHRHIIYSVPASSGSGSGAVTFSYTISANGSGPTVAMRLRTTPIVAPVELAVSSNIAASAATSTTAQLSAPSGKTTSDFTAGRISDDTNPLPAIDLAADDYTELEWCVSPKAAGGIVDTDVIDFRVTINGTPLDTYAVTPTWTVGTPGSDYTLTAESGSATVAGTAGALTRGARVAANAGSYTLSGTAANLERGLRVSAEAGGLTLAGTAATLARTGRLSAESGSVSVAGTAASLEYGRRLSAEAGAVVLTGTDAALARGKRLAADAGSVAWSGTAASLLRASRVSAQAGAVALTGTDADLRKAGSYSLPADPGIVTVTGTAATVTAGRLMSASAGSVTLTSTAAALARGRRLAADAGSVSLTGTAATLRPAWRVSAGPGAITLTGTDATLRKVGSFSLTAEAGAVSLTGHAASLAYGRRLVASAGSIALTGNAASMRYARALDADGGAFMLSGSAASLVWTGEVVSRVSLGASVQASLSLSASSLPSLALSASATASLELAGSVE